MHMHLYAAGAVGGRCESFLLDLSEIAFSVALRHGVKGPLPEVERGLNQVVRSLLGRSGPMNLRRQVMRGRWQMKSRLSRRIGPALVLAFGVGLTGCARAPSGAPATAPVPVAVSYPVERSVTDYADFTARTAAVDSVEVRAH